MSRKVHKKFSIAIHRYNTGLYVMHPTRKEFDEGAKPQGFLWEDRVEMYESNTYVDEIPYLEWRAIKKTGPSGFKTCTWMSVDELRAFVPFVNTQLRKGNYQGSYIDEIWLVPEFEEGVLAINSVHEFIEKNVEFGEGYKVRFLNVFQRYQAFMKENGFSWGRGRTIFSTEFMRLSLERGHGVRRAVLGTGFDKHRGYKGCRLKE